MMCILLLSILYFVQFSNAEINELDVQYIADTVNLSHVEAQTYSAPKNAYQYIPENGTVTDYGTFDYVIVGGGSAGSVLATRLSENADTTVLLLEAGGRSSTAVNIPGTVFDGYNSSFNWNYTSVPQTTCCLGMAGHRCTHPRGKGLGGSSLINSVQYSRGNKDNYDSWAEAGNRGWSYKDVLPYFKKSENSQIDGDSGYHSKGGLLNVEYVKPDHPIFYPFIEGFKEQGVKVVDYNGKEQIGVARFQFNKINGYRDHTDRAFLYTAQSRPNLKILVHSYARKIVIDKSKQAKGVIFDHNNQAFYASASKEVIVSAGSIGSPQLLMLSGIGPSRLLKSLNITVIQDLPVGENYQNHPAYFNLKFTTNLSLPEDDIYENARKFLHNRGPLTLTTGYGVVFLRTNISRTKQNVPNVEAVLNNEGGRLGFNVVVLNPASRGTVSLNSSNPYEYPLIDPRFLSDKNNEDIENLYAAINLIRKLLKTTSFRRINATLLDDIVPQCKNYTEDSKDQWFCQLRNIASHLYHPVGTCKMAPSPSQGGVVNNELKVYGVKKLRVIDASIMPTVIYGHTNAPTIMIAEKMADLIKQNS